MTDDLVVRLRCYPANRLCRQVADALEAQARRIAELERQLEGAFQSNLQHCRLQDAQFARIAELEAEFEAKCKECSELKIELAKWVNYWRDKDNKALQARIAELTAALKPFADIAKQTEHWSGPPVSVPLYIIRATAAALKETGDE